MDEEVKQIMTDHLKLLAETAADCEDENLGIITSAMVQTATLLMAQNSDF